LETSIENSLQSPSATTVEDDRPIHPPKGLRVLVAYASKTGSTRGIAECIGEKLRKNGTWVDVSNVGSANDLDKYDAFVIGSALYMFHWMKEARQFVSENRSVLACRPVWIFSSGPTGTKTTDKKGRDLREVSGPKEIGELRESINPRDHHVFFGAFYPDRVKGATGWFSRFVPKEDQGDFRNWSEIEAWANNITDTLSRPRPA
jgi:menaquinone-dependent protoporphyrinogen oxidase